MVLYTENRRSCQTVEVLLKEGLDQAITDNSGYVPLHYAVKSGHVALTKLFLESKNWEKAINTFGYDGNVPLHLAAIGNKPEIITQLVKKGCDINTQDRKSGRTPYFYAIEEINLEAAEVLISLNANTTKSNYAGQLPPIIKGLKKMIADLKNKPNNDLVLSQNVKSNLKYADVQQNILTKPTTSYSLDNHGKQLESDVIVKKHRTSATVPLKTRSLRNKSKPSNLVKVTASNSLSNTFQNKDSSKRRIPNLDTGLKKTLADLKNKPNNDLVLSKNVNRNLKYIDVQANTSTLPTTIYSLDNHGKQLESVVTVEKHRTSTTVPLKTHSLCYKSKPSNLVNNTASNSLSNTFQNKDTSKRCILNLDTGIRKMDGGVRFPCGRNHSSIQMNINIENHYPNHIKEQLYQFGIQQKDMYKTKTNLEYHSPIPIKDKISHHFRIPQRALYKAVKRNSTENNVGVIKNTKGTIYKKFYPLENPSFAGASDTEQPIVRKELQHESSVKKAKTGSCSSFVIENENTFETSSENRFINESTVTNGNNIVNTRSFTSFLIENENIFGSFSDCKTNDETAIDYSILKGTRSTSFNNGSTLGNLPERKFYHDSTVVDYSSVKPSAVVFGKLQAKSSSSAISEKVDSSLLLRSMSSPRKEK